jgi:CheY-like chemotaxis protein
MPKMDGTQLAESMRMDRRLAEIPVVAVTADVDVGSTYDMSLFAKVIAKPVTTGKLKALFGLA